MEIVVRTADLAVVERTALDQVTSLVAVGSVEVSQSRPIICNENGY